MNAWVPPKWPTGSIRAEIYGREVLVIAACAVTLQWVDWFNNRRLLEPIGNMPPAEAEARYYAEIQATAMAA